MCARICRLCFKDLDPDDPDVRSILDDTLQIAFKCVFPFKIWFSEDLPMYACKQCSWNVLDFHSYIEIVQKNQDTFAIKGLLDNTTSPTARKRKEEMDKENAGPLKNSKRLSSISFSEQYAPCEVNVDNITGGYCKVEPDNIMVTNEIHPDLMDFSYETFEECNASITWENYKITTSVYDAATELPEFLNTCKDLNDISVKQNKTPVCHNGMKKKANINGITVSQKKKKCFIKSKKTVELNRINKKLITNAETNADFQCTVCGMKFKAKKQLKNHNRNHRTEKCQICKKTLKNRYMSRHLQIHKPVRPFMNQEKLEHHIETTHSFNSNVKKKQKAIKT